MMYRPINNRMQYDRINSLVNDAIKDGGVIAAGGSAAVDPAGGYFFQPTIISNVAEGSRIVDEEQFGPVLPVIKYRTVEEAIERANNTVRMGTVWNFVYIYVCVCVCACVCVCVFDAEGRGVESYTIERTMAACSAFSHCINRASHQCAHASCCTPSLSDVRADMRARFR